MFYSETLLSKTGPLARVWLAANLEKKLSKPVVLQQSIESSVNAIVDQGQAPMALRLSGQLLLGVVRIYSRKAKYLLDDCNEALMKIKMAFRPGNVDLPADQSHTVNPATLTLPDALTDLDLFAPMPDPSILLSQPPGSDLGQQDPTLLDWGTSQLMSNSIEVGRGHDDNLMLENDDLELDIGPSEPTVIDTSIEVGRDASEAALGDDTVDRGMKLYDDDLDLDVGDEPTITRADTTIPAEDALPGIEDDIQMGGMDEEFALPGLEEEGTLPAVPGAERPRESLSPLSTIRSSVERNVETMFQHRTPFDLDPEDEDTRPAQRSKKRRVLQFDDSTELTQNYFKVQLEDRSRILKPTSFLPRDPTLLALMQMQQNGSFVSSILGDGRSKGWAPELRGIMSLEVVRRSGDLKRKRDSGIADREDDEVEEHGRRASTERTPHSEIGMAQAEISELPSGLKEPSAMLTSEAPEALRSEISARGPEPEDEFALPPSPARAAEALEEDEEALSPPPDNFDETTYPLLHPADSGLVSQGTKHAVHILRERFGAEAESSPGQRAKSAVLFQEMLPEATTNRENATKMFFEVLVLATKDAIKVEQQHGVLGGDIKIRAKRGLWGAWAETSAGGEIASQVEGHAAVAA